MSSRARLRIQNYEPVHVPTNHLKPSNWERLCWQWEKLIFHASLLWSRWLWFVTFANISRVGFVFVVAILVRQVVMQDALPMGGLVRYETTMDSVQLMDSRLERFEKQQMMWQHVYQEKLEEMEKSMQASFKEIQKETEQAISKLRSELTKHKGEHEENAKSTAEATSLFHKEMAGKLETVENQLANRLAEFESRILAANERIRMLSSSIMLKSSNETTEELLVGVKRRHAVNLASRSHGASIVPTLTSKATTSSSLLLNLVDSVFPLETYNFAITERTHITPSEAFCFDGSQGKLTVRLWANTTIEAVEYEHDYWHDVVPISAPERYDVMACMDHSCQQKELLGECNYPSDEKTGPAQICEMENRSITTDQVQIVFRTNHGQQYTCVYLLRILSWR